MACTSRMMGSSHPLDPLLPAELRTAAEVLRDFLKASAEEVYFKVINLQEPPKKDVLNYLSTPLVSGLDRKSYIYYHVRSSRIMSKAIVNITQKQVEENIDLPNVQGPADIEEIEIIHELCNTHPDVIAEGKKLNLPVGARLVNDPWCYGTDDPKETRRLYQCYMYIALNDDPEANHYSLPAPFAPIFDMSTRQLVSIERLPLGADAEIDSETQPWNPLRPVEYSAKLLGQEAFRKDLKPLQIVQPEGPSFTINGRQITWQKWSFQLGWTVREGPVLNHVQYDGRSLFYRVSMSEMTVPYGDPRSPYHRKQAFDLGDSGFGICSNSLALGCDCLGHIAYFDGIRTSARGEPIVLPNAVCMHEIDQGIGWKHTNFRTNSASVVRNRQLVIQCTATVMNYEYILAFILDQAANLHVEVRATGIVSTMPIRDGLSASPWGTVVAPGVLAVNHQHLFSLRVDPCLDGIKNSVVYEDCVPVPSDSEMYGFGNAFYLDSTKISKPGGYDLDLTRNRTFKIINESHINAVSGKPIGYKLHPVPSQMLMMAPHTFNYKRGIFSTKPVWVTRYNDNELWAAGEFTNQSKEDTGLAQWVARNETVDNEDIVLWHTFGVTHVTRPEDFPVMPVEIMTASLKPTSFFEQNPSNDVPRSNQEDNDSTLARHGGSYHTVELDGCCPRKSSL